MYLMFILSATCSLVMLVVVLGLVCRSRSVGAAVLLAWPFLLLGMWPPRFMPTYLLNVLLVAVGGLVCRGYGARPRVFVVWSLAATLVSYGGALYLAVEHVR